MDDPYKAMYLAMDKSVTDTIRELEGMIEFLKNAQRECEEIFMSTDDGTQ